MNTHTAYTPADRAFWPLLLLAVCMPWLGYASFPLFDIDEGAFTASTSEMFMRGDFLATWLNGEPRYDKPVLAYWLQAGAALLLGFNEWGFRLPSVLAGSLWVLVTYAFTARVAGREAGLLAGIMVAASLGPLLIAKAATADALLNLAIAAAGYSAWRWLETRQARWLWLCWGVMALGFLVKGPVAAVVPGGAVALYLALGRDWRGLRDFALDLRAWALFLAIAAPWFVLLTLRDGPGFLAGFFLQHNVGRFTAPMEGHTGAVFYYLPVLLVTLLPFTGLLAVLAARLGDAWRTPWMRFGLIWFALVLVLFSASGTKLPHYLYYGYGGLIPVLAWAAAHARRPRLLLLPAVLAGALLLALPAILAAFADQADADYAHALASLPDYFAWPHQAVFGALVLFSLGLMFLPRLSAGRRLGLAGLALAAAVSLSLLPAVGGLLQDPVRAAGQHARGLSGPLVMAGLHKPSFQTYAGRRVERRAPRSGDLVLTPARHTADLPPHQVLQGFGDLVLVRML